MSKILLLYYSRTGYTAAIANQLAEYENWDIDEIVDLHSRTGAWGFTRSLFDVLVGRHPAIRDIQVDPSRYELVVLGASVWRGHLCSPMRTYLHKNRHQFKNIAFFCTYGSWGAENAARECAQLAGKSPIATLAITDTEIDKAAYWPKLDAFVKQIRQLVDEVKHAA